MILVLSSLSVSVGAVLTKTLLRIKTGSIFKSQTFNPSKNKQKLLQNDYLQRDVHGHVLRSSLF